MKAQLETANACEAFNLAGERGHDPWRIERERIAALERRSAAAEYQRRMQRTLEQCPGFVACDAPSSPDGRGRVSITPGLVIEAAVWLKRRFHTSENIGLSLGDSLVFEIAPRIRRVTRGAPRRKVSFAPAVQYELRLAQ